MPDYSKIPSEEELYEDEYTYDQFEVTVSMTQIQVGGEPRFAYTEVLDLLDIEEGAEVTEPSIIRALNQLQEEYTEAICERHDNPVPPEKLH